MQSCKVPIEVCERVIDCLITPVHNLTLDNFYEILRSWPTLYACSLVCRDWVHRSQHHLFRCVTLRTTSQADAFLDILARYPHRAHLVQFLAILPLPPPPPPSSPKSVSPSLRSSTVHTPSSNLPAPSAFPVARSSSHSPQFSVTASDSQQSNMEDTAPQSESGNLAHPPIPESSEFDASLRDRTQDQVEEIIPIPPCYYNWIYKALTRLPSLLVNLSILHLNKLPTLHPQFIRLITCFKTTRTLFLSELENQSFSEITQVLNRLPQLKIIYFVNPKWVRPVRFFPSRPLQLEGFSCYVNNEHMGTDTLDWLGSLQDLSRLSCLRIGVLQNSDLHKAHHILQQTMHSLRFLSLESNDAGIFGDTCPIHTAIQTDKSFPAGSLSLSSHSKPECLRIRDLALLSPNDIALISSRISQLFSPSLVCLTIGLFENLDLESLVTSQSSWAAIDYAFSRPEFNRLAYLMMDLVDSYEGGINHETLRATFQNILPQCYQRGILWVVQFMNGLHGQRVFHICEDDEREFNLLQLVAPYFRV